MDLTARLAAAATRRVAVLVAEVPGWGRTRCAVERELRERGWRRASSPADADVLLVCGVPGDALADAVDAVWDQLPGPRARLSVTTPDDVPAALDTAAAHLRDGAAQSTDAAARPAAFPEEHDDSEDSDDEGGSDEGGSDGDMDMDDSDGDMDMDMPMPGGIPLAGQGSDRDGLDLDELHVPLGPVLPDWPAGLVLRCTLQGDLVTAAAVDVLGPAGEVPPAGDLVHGTPADCCDRAARLLAVAGWDDAATAVARVRDALLDAPEAPAGRRDLARLTRRVRRSPALRWTLRGAGRTADGGDAHTRLLALLDGARAGLADAPPPVRGTPVSGLADEVAGRDLADVHLLVASLDLDPVALAHAGPPS